MKAIFIKSHTGSLVPTDEAALRIVNRYGPGEEVLMEHKRGRSAANHARFFKFLQITFDMQEDYQSLETWRFILECAAGHGEYVMNFEGKSVFIPKSIAWDKLTDEDEFRTVFSNVVQGFVHRYGDRLDQDTLSLVASF